MAAVEDKNWKKISALLSTEYSDRWGHTKATAVERTQQVMSQFFAATVVQKDVELSEADGAGTVRALLSLQGTGSPVAELAVERMATLQKPFVFQWRQQSWKPWDWALVSVDQPEIEIPDF